MGNPYEEVGSNEIDIVLRINGWMTGIESKYRLPEVGTEQFERLIAQGVSVANEGGEFVIAAMRYGNPILQGRILSALEEAGVDPTTVSFVTGPGALFRYLQATFPGLWLGR